MNILTFDVEEWFHLLDNSSTRSAEQWERYPVRIHENMERIFRILEETDTRATFFIIGWIARKYPEIVRKIAEKYDIGSHTMNHKLVWQQGAGAFRQDVDSSVKYLEDLTGKKIKYFRAPGFSIRRTEPWAFEVLSDLGIETDCSIFPAHHAHGGFPSYGKGEPAIIEYNGRSIREFPVCTKEMHGRHVVFCGGGYFRLFPYFLIKKWTREQQNYVLSYIHPRDLDAGQPMIKGLPWERKFRSYVGLRWAEKKFRHYLTDFDFMDITEASERIDWDKVRKIKL